MNVWKGSNSMTFLEFLARYRTAAGNLFFQSVTYMAQEVFVIVIICWLYWCSNKKLAYTLGFSYFTSGILVQGLKIMFRIPRPWILNPQFKAVESAVPGATGYSFPSGHTQSCTALYGTLAFHARKKSLKFLCWLMIFLIGFSRMYLGCHTPKDVLTAFAISVICTASVYHLLYRKEYFEGKERTVCIVMGVLSILLTVYAVILYKNGTIALEYAGDCVKAGGAGVAFAIGYYVEKRCLDFAVPRGMKGKLLRMSVGLIIALVLQVGLKPVLGISLPASFVRYFLVVLWIIMVYPMIFSRIKKKKAVL